MSVCCECCVLSGRGLCDELITSPDESYRLWCVVCDLETPRMKSPWPALGHSAQKKKKKFLFSSPNFLFKVLILRFRTLFGSWFCAVDLILNWAIWDSSVWPHDITGTLLFFLYSASCETLFHHFDCIFAFLSLMAGTCAELCSMLRNVLTLCFKWLSWPSLVWRYEVSQLRK